MSSDINLQSFSQHRLMGEAIPHDLELLLGYSNEVRELTEIEISDTADWAPWLDFSYLSEKDLKDPDISANVKAIAEVCQYVSFFAMTEESEYYGYWRGPKMRSLSQSPIICFDNEGQFNMRSHKNFVEVLLADTYNEDAFLQVKQLLEAAGMDLPYASNEDIPYSEIPKDEDFIAPGDLHKQLFYSIRERDK